jgi:hypothetical protein
MKIPSTRDLVVAFAAFAALTLAAPPPAAAASAKTVICKDGTKDEGGQGACSGHGGVDKTATDKAASKEASKEAKKHKEPAEPKHATVTCKDGTKDEGGQGACSGHGGVDKSATDKAASKEAKKHKEPAEPKAAKPTTHPAEHAAQPATHPGEKPDDAAKGPPTARCKDGTFSHAEHHTGACSNHGGVEEWLDKK